MIKMKKKKKEKISFHHSHDYAVESAPSSMSWSYTCKQWVLLELKFCMGCPSIIMILSVFVAIFTFPLNVHLNGGIPFHEKHMLRYWLHTFRLVIESNWTELRKFSFSALPKAESLEGLEGTDIKMNASEAHFSVLKENCMMT